MNSVSIVIRTIVFSLFAVLPCRMVSGFVFRPVRLESHSTNTQLRMSDDKELLDSMKGDNTREPPNFALKQDEEQLLKRLEGDKQVIKMLIEEKELFKQLIEERKGKERLFERIIEIQNRTIEIQKEKEDKVIAEKERNIELQKEIIEIQKEKEEKLIELQDSIISDLKIRVLRADSKLSVRGIVECFADSLAVEVSRAAKRDIIRAIYKDKRLSRTLALQGAGELAYSKNLESKSKTYPNTILLKGWYEECFTEASWRNGVKCSQFFERLYSELSLQIHGAPWGGPEIGNTLQGVPNGEMYSCVVKKMFKEKFNLDLIDLAAMPKTEDGKAGSSEP